MLQSSCDCWKAQIPTNSAASFDMKGHKALRSCLNFTPSTFVGTFVGLASAGHRMNHMNPWSFMRRSNHLHSRTGCAPNKTYQKIAGCCRGSLWSWWLRKGCSARCHSKMEVRISGDLSFLGEMISSPEHWKFCMEVFGRRKSLFFLPDPVV